MRDWRVNIERFTCNAIALVRAHRIERAHVVQTVGELDQDDADIARHGQQHFSKAFGLLLGFCGEVKTVELGKPVNKVPDLSAEFFDQFLLGNTLVVHDIVQKRRAQRVDVKLPARADLGHGDGVRDVRGAAGSELAKMRLISEAVGVANLGDILGIEIGFENLLQARHGGDCGFGFGRGRGCRTGRLGGNARLWGAPGKPRTGLEGSEQPG